MPNTTSIRGCPLRPLPPDGGVEAWMLFISLLIEAIELIDWIEAIDTIDVIDAIDCVCHLKLST